MSLFAQFRYGAVLSFFLLVLCGSGHAELDDAAPPPRTSKDANRLVLEKLAAGQQKKAEAYINDYVDQHPDDLRMTFLKAACLQSRFSDDEATPVFRKVIEIDKDSVCAQCAAIVVEMDAGRDLDVNFAKLRRLAEDNPDDLVIRWMLGVKCRVYGRYEEGARHYEKIVAVWKPGPSLMCLTYGNLLDDLGRFEEALVQHRKAAEQEPAGWSYNTLAGSLSHLHRYKEANEVFEDAVNIAPTHIFTWRNWAQSLLHEGNYDAAIEKCDNLIDLNIYDDFGWTVWGKALFAQGHYREAAQKLRVALLSDWSLGSNRRLVARCRLRMSREKNPARLHQFDGAMADETKMIASHPDSERYWHRGSMRWANGELDLALADFNEAIRLDPEKFHYRPARAMTLLDKGEYERALADARRTVQAYPNVSAYRHLIGHTLQRIGKLDEAVAAFAEAIRLNRFDFEAYCDCGLIRESQGRLDEAITFYNQAVHDRQTDGDARFLRANLYRKLGKLKEAIADYTKAVDFEPRHAEAYFNRGLTYRQLGDLKRAKADFAEATRLDPELKEPK